VTDPELVRLVDSLEDNAAGYLTIEEVERAAGQSLKSAITNGLLLVDHRTRPDGTLVTQCRLNRHHPLVMELTSW
jgi:hypothetical protein